MRRRIFEGFEKHNALYEKRISEGVEKNRKGNAVITVKDKNGNSVSGVKIQAVQKTHEFKYGANLFMLDEFDTKKDNELYRKYFSECFNMATLPFYWSSLEPEEGTLRLAKDCTKMYRRPAIDLCIEYCEKHNIEPRAHCLVYDGHSPEWLKDEPVAKVKEKTEAHMRVLSERYKDVIPCWEVVNETLLPDYACKHTAFYREPDHIDWSFKTAEKYFPNNILSINDCHGNIWRNGWPAAMFNYFRSPYYMLIDRAIKSGTRIDAIGFQFHMFGEKEEEYRLADDFYNPEHLIRVMDQYEHLGKPLQITEVTIPAYSNDVEDEAVQAEMIEKLYSLWFAQKNMSQIVYWNLVDGYAAGEKADMTSGENRYYGGLLRSDLTPKPAYYVIKNLFEKKWHTEKELVTNESGKACFRGFYGKYKVVLDGITTEISISKDGGNEFEFII